MTRITAGPRVRSTVTMIFSRSRPPAAAKNGGGYQRKKTVVKTIVATMALAAR